jgi:MFS family permease
MSLSRPVPGDASPAKVPALAEPAVNVRAGWIAGVVLVNVGINAAFFGPLQVLLAQQAQVLDPVNKEVILALVTGCGAAVSLVANPIFGAFSDRTTSRFGRRVPWVLGGAVLGVAALLGLTGAPNVAAMTVLWCLVQAGCNGAVAAITATVPDRVPRGQRGWVGGLFSMGVTAGIVGGAVIAAAVAGFAAGYVVCAIVLFLCVVPYVSNSQDARLDPAERPAFSWSKFAAGFYISPRRYPDFGWAWLTRFLVNLGNHMVTLYLFFFLQDAVGYQDPADGVLILTGLYAAMTIVTAVLGGRLSDWMGKRKPLVIASSAVIASASLILAFFPTMTGAVIGALVLGIGFGAYLAVDFALITEVLPTAADRGKDMGVINVANSLPQVLAPVVAAPLVLTAGGYLSLYVTAAAIGLLGAVFVVKIKSVA